MERSSISLKSRNLAFYLEKINDIGFEVEMIFNDGIKKILKE